MLKRWKPWFVFNPFHPWFIHNPRQIGQRLRFLRGRYGVGYTPWRTAWGGELLVNPRGVIGWQVAAMGVYDLPLSEVITRLVRPGDTVVDAGANVGYTVVLEALAVGPGGCVIAFEPNPEVLPVLRQNVQRNGVNDRVTVHARAVSDFAGQMDLSMPTELAENDGLASLYYIRDGARTVPVEVVKLDDVFTGSAAVLKVDVETAEAYVFRGAAQLLKAHRFRHILFEEFDTERSPAVALLRKAGYQLFSFASTTRGLVVAPLDSGQLSTMNEPSLIATVAPDELVARCSAPGWQCLKGASA